MVLATGVLVTASVLIALVAGPLANVSGRAAADLVHGTPYYSAVLGDSAALGGSAE